ncbi:Stk1 family PASTA domain-containing Ser/Thr kinase [Arthrobacter cupressi]|uniref:non-specific serine/threonine protein kinase n=1 Tax=Arthrobacter cupressi TaxID=1045773 RepID=A0A1G8VKF1_9MICC|nr:Stk1 family PASTA domain-containing Ser/Thr kinase [Arthrobacter cupressi]NYD79488.1 serine/threonine-protein kinase [Arthrobacter cupressi]SDJ66551.1 serine/threonine protein kinase [Arthrobacter cupressi]
MQEQVSDHLLGSLVDQRYLVRTRLAGGGMSTVYLATDERLDRDVALKVLHPHLANDASFLERLRREARAAASLSHPHVVGVLDQGQDGHIAYLVMEYIKGHTLRDVLQEKGGLSPRLALALIDPVIEGLAAAHSAGLIHRDVKPENVLIADDGRIKVGDFGLARAVTAATSTGSLIGTVAYLAPELVLGEAADARSDIYSAGVMLYEMLTGTQPYSGEVPIQVAYKHVNAEIPAPSAAAPGLVSDLDELVQWCTAKDPEQRPVDGGALLSELRHIRTTLSDEQLDYAPLSARPSLAAAEQAASLDTTVLGSADAAHTEIISSGQHPTSVLPQPAQGISAAAFPTSVLPPAGPLPAGTDRDASSAQLSPREEKRAARQAEKDRARAAATPSRTLREGNVRRRAVIWASVILLLAVLAGTAGWFFGMGPGSPGTIPALKNRPAQEAEQLLRTAGFQSRPQDVFDDEVKAGYTVGTDPAAGVEIRKFLPVTLFVSKGPQLFPLANLDGLSLEQAKDALAGAEMTLGRVSEKYDEQAPAGTILSQAPAKDTPVRHGTAVSLVVSKGPQPLPVPDVRGMDRAAAVKAISDAGLTAKVAAEEIFDKKAPAGTVLRQSPSDGTLNRGGTVTLTLSKGPRLVEVPNFVGKSAKQAERELKKLGFEVELDVFGGILGLVQSQDPVDTMAPEGSTVTLRVV